MNYQRIYDQIIERAKSENRQKGTGIYYEKHHIIPRCLGGSDNKENLILLTAREHFLAHWLLHEIYPENRKLSIAFWMMCNVKDNYQERYIPSSRIIEYSKQHFSINHISKLTYYKEKLSSFRKGKTYEELYGLEKSKKLKKQKADLILGDKNPMKNKDTLSKFIGKNNPFFGKTHTKEIKEKLSSSRGKRKTSYNYKNLECPHCNKIGISYNMTRYHFNNCKHKL